jgi:hypothetical protein
LAVVAALAGVLKKSAPARVQVMAKTCRAIRNTFEFIVMSPVICALLLISNGLNFRLVLACPCWHLLPALMRSTAEIGQTANASKD